MVSHPLRIEYDILPVSTQNNCTHLGAVILCYVPVSVVGRGVNPAGTTLYLVYVYISNTSKTPAKAVIIQNGLM